MEHMYVLVYHKKIKYHLLTEKVYPLKIFLEAIDNPNIRFLKPPEGIEKLNMGMLLNLHKFIFGLQ